MRDAICELFGWPPESEDWKAFIEGPGDEDVLRLCEHLGLEVFDPIYPEHRKELEERLDYPGICLYLFRRFQAMHCMYQPDIRNLRPLPPQYSFFKPDPELVRIVVDPDCPLVGAVRSEPARLCRDARPTSVGFPGRDEAPTRLSGREVC